MLKTIYIRSYRQLEDIAVEDAKLINIFIGENNSGKTSILEAIQLFKDENVVGNIIRISRKRENIFGPFLNQGVLSPYDSFINTFNKQSSIKSIYIMAESNLTEKITVSLDGEEYLKLYIPEENNNKFNRRYIDSGIDGEIRVFNGSFNYDSPFAEVDTKFEFEEINSDFYMSRIPSRKQMNINYISPIDHYTSGYTMRSIKDIIKSGDKHDILKLLRIFDENIVGFETIGERGRTIAYLKHRNKGMIPLSIFGDGLKKILTIASAIIKSKNGVLLIDEIETAIHKKALIDVFSWFIKACFSYNVQVFLTTHSIEAVDALLEGLNNHLDDIACYRLENYKDRIFVSRYSGEKLNKIRNNQGLDVR